MVLSYQHTLSQLQAYALPVHELHADSKALCHVSEREGAIGLQQLCVCLDAHLPHVVTSMGRQKTITLELTFSPD